MSLGLLQSLAAEEERTAQELMDSFIAAAEAEDWDKAIAFGHKLADSSRDHPIPAYLLAAAYVKTGRADDAAHWLVEAASRGYESYEEIEGDPDFARLRGHADFLRALEMMRSNAVASRSRFENEALESEPIILWQNGNGGENEQGTRPAPEAVIVALHAYGGRAESTAERWRNVALARSALLVVPRAIRPAGSGYAWIDAGETQFLVKRALEVAARIHDVEALPVILAGFSEGGDMVQTLAFDMDFPLAGYIALGSSYRLEPQRSLPTEPTFASYFIVGEADPSRHDTRSTHERLVQAGWPSAVSVVPDLGHAFPENNGEFLAEAVDFILQSSAELTGVRDSGGNRDGCTTPPNCPTIGLHLSASKSSPASSSPD
ncbi:MAG: hypothetical protein ACE5GX_16375 [Thermoanaerobaculia bacterium]